MLIKEAVGLTRVVKDVTTALRVIDWWEPTRCWKRSVDILIQVNLGNKSAEEGRKAFVAAAREAGALIEQ